jgi:hypothetical protein
MKTFKSYLTEAAEASTRQNILHLQKMKDEEFIEFVRKIKNEMNGKLAGLKVSLKVDGGGGRFGKDSNGRPFFEGSRTGPIFEPKAFSTHAKGKGYEGEALLRAGHYDDMFDIITKSDFVKSLPNNTKVICEIMYNPMAEISDDGVKFVTVKYDKSKLGKTMTIVPFKVVVASTGQEHAQSAKIMKDLFAHSNGDIRFVDPGLKMTSAIDISAFVDPILSLNAQSLEILRSRKASDKVAKENVKVLIQKVKDSLAEYILKHENIVDKFMLGKDIEGLVLNINGQDIKVTTAEFKASKAKEKK